MRSLSPMIVYASIAGLLLACSDSSGPSDQPNIVSPPGNTEYPAGAFQVSPATATLQPGQTYRFTTTYSGNPALQGTPSSVTWYSSDDKVATVSGGLVRAVNAGQARIVAIWGGTQASALMTVTGPAKKHEDAIACVKRAPSAGNLLMAQC